MSLDYENVERLHVRGLAVGSAFFDCFLRRHLRFRLLTFAFSALRQV